MSYVKKSQVARSVPFDNTNNDFESQNVQEALEELGISASPGFTFGRSGNSNSGTYLLVDSVPSNNAGRIVPFTNATLTNVFVACQNNATFSLQVQKRIGNSFTTIYTLNVSNLRKKTETVNPMVPLDLNDEIAIRVGSGSAQNIVVGLVLRGKR